MDVDAVWKGGKGGKGEKGGKGVCYSCGKTGHQSKDCWAAGKGAGKVRREAKQEKREAKDRREAKEQTKEKERAHWSLATTVARRAICQKIVGHRELSIHHSRCTCWRSNMLSLGSRRLSSRCSGNRRSNNSSNSRCRWEQEVLKLARRRQFQLATKVTTSSRFHFELCTSTRMWRLVVPSRG